jgi:hypothetical protein
MKWTITELNAIEGVIKSVKYLVEMSKDGKNVASEGYWYFEQDGGLPISALTEDNVIEWVRQATMKNGQNMVETRLAEQLAAMSEPVQLPWKPAIFKLDL